MKTKFFLCMKPTAVETDDDEECIKLPPPESDSGKSSGRRNRDLRRRKRVAPLKNTRQLCIKSNGNISQGSSENNPVVLKGLLSCNLEVMGSSPDPSWLDSHPDPMHTGIIGFGKGSPKVPKPVSEVLILKSFSDEESMISNDKDSYGCKSNSGAYMMIISLFFTMFFGKLIGIVGTLILVCSLYPHRKNDCNYFRISENMVVNWPEKGSPEEYKKRVIMAGLLERKNHYR